MSDLYLIIGHTGTGKSSFVKEITAEPKNIFVFDVNNEYNNLQAIHLASRAKFIPGEQGTYKDFIKACFDRVNTNIIFEEATGFFSGATNKETMRLIISKRHKNLNLIFLFHSINRVPPGIYELANYVVLFKTNDNPEIIKKKYPKLLKPFQELQNKPQFSKLILKML